MFRKTLLLLVLSLWSAAVFGHVIHHHKPHRHIRHHRVTTHLAGVHHHTRVHARYVRHRVRRHPTRTHLRYAQYVVKRPRYERPLFVPAQSSEECLATAIYWESKSEPTEGKAAVGYVIMKRASNRHFPTTPCGVVYQRGRDHHGVIRCQFDFACLPPQRKNAAQMAEARRVAREVLARTIPNPIGNALFFQEARLRSRPSHHKLYRKVIAHQAFFSLTPFDSPSLASR